MQFVYISGSIYSLLELLLIDIYYVKVKVKVKLRFSAPSAGIAEIEQT